MKKSLSINLATSHRLIRFIEHSLLHVEFRNMVSSVSYLETGINSGFLRARSRLELQSMAKAIVMETLDRGSVELLLQIGMSLSRHGLTYTDSDFLPHHSFNAAWWHLKGCVGSLDTGGEYGG